MLHSGLVKMLNDHARNEFYRKALQDTAKDKIVLDIGTGTGLLAAYALKAGAKFVYCVERDFMTSNIAQFVLSKLFDQSQFKVINCDFWSADIDTKIPKESIDIMVSETVGPALFDEGMVNTWQCARPFLKTDALSIPDKLHIDAYIYDDLDLPGIVDIDKLTGAPESTPKRDTVLHADNLLYEEFYLALDKYVKQQNCHQWIDLSQVNQKPHTILNSVSWATKDQLPKILFADMPYPFHMQAQIEFEVDIAEPSSVVLVGHISFQDTILTLHHGCWSVSPCASLLDPGKYKFRHNPDLVICAPNAWFIEKI